MIFSIIVLAMSLSFDAFTTGAAYGMRKVRIPLASKLIICLFSVIYSGASLTLGSTFSSILTPLVSKLIGICILGLMGIWIIIQAFVRKDGTQGSCEMETGPRTLAKIAIKSLGITIEVIKDPSKGDIDKSGTIDARESLLLGLALSVDAIGVGIGSALAGLNTVFIPFAVGFSQLVFLYIGTYLGGKLLIKGRLNEKLMSVLPGILLIFMALIRI